MDNTILQKLEEQIKTVEETLIKLDKNINGDKVLNIPALSMKNPIHIAEILRIKTIKLGLIGKLRAECYRAVKLSESINDVKVSELRLELVESDPDSKITIINDKIRIKMKKDNLDLVEAKYLQESYMMRYNALEKNIEAIKYKYNAFKR